MSKILPVAGGGMRFLASVANPFEAAVAAGAGADILDAKNPDAGPLGALEPAVIRAIVAKIDGRKPVSATIGDHPCEPEPLVKAAMTVAETGVDIVKAGIYGGPKAREAIAAVGQALSQRTSLVAVMIADSNFDLSLIPAFANAGFKGVMLDTADKSSITLTDILSLDQCCDFIRNAHANGLFAGLAGSLSEKHIKTLTKLSPDILGFRGALCRASNRRGEIDGFLVASIAHRIREACRTLPTSAKRPAGKDVHV